MALAIFDLDNTLIAGDSDHAWGEFLVEKSIVDAQVYKEANDQFLLDYQNGELDILKYLSFALRPLAAHPTEQLLKWREEFFLEKIKPLMLDKAIKLVEKHRAAGDTLLIITATNHFVTEPIAQAFGIDTLIATLPEQVDGRYTGKVSGTPSFKEGKITRLNEWLETNHHTLEGSFFYSDSHNDLPLLKLVSTPVSIDPDDTLREYSEQNGWPIQTLRS